MGQSCRSVLTDGHKTHTMTKAQLPSTEFQAPHACQHAGGKTCTERYLSLALLGDPGKPVEPSGLLPPRAVFRYLRNKSVRLRVAPTVALIRPQEQLRTHNQGRRWVMNVPQQRCKLV